MGDNPPNPDPPPAFFLTDRDKQILSMKDEDYHYQTWDDLKSLIANNHLDQLTRVPSDLKRYLAWSHQTKTHYGSMTDFLLEKKLLWTPLPGTLEAGSPAFFPKSTTPFAAREDYRILLNDWPYGFAPGIVHVCVWLKVRLPVDDVMGDLTQEGRTMVERFVGEVFERGLGVKGEDKVLWFKNWTGLQSVRGLEHVHVLLRDVDEAKLKGVLDEPEASD